MHECNLCNGCYTNGDQAGLSQITKIYIVVLYLPINNTSRFSRRVHRVSVTKQQVIHGTNKDGSFPATSFNTFYFEVWVGACQWSMRHIHTNQYIGDTYVSESHKMILTLNPPSKWINWQIHTNGMV